MELYHSNYVKVDKPRVLKGKYTKDFGAGFYVPWPMTRYIIMWQTLSVESSTVNSSGHLPSSSTPLTK